MEDIILRGAGWVPLRCRLTIQSDLALAALSMWSAAHGLTMLVIDHLTRADLCIDDMIETVLRTVTPGLTALPGTRRQRRRDKKAER